MMTKLPVLVLVLPAVLLLQTLAAQDPEGPTEASAADSRKALAQRVAKAHRGDSRVVIDRYRATITILPLGADQDNVTIELNVTYGRNIARAKGVTAEMIRYRVNEGDKPMERGKDPRPWMRIGKEVTSLGGRHDSADPELLESHTRLCRQMLQLLDAGAILAALDGDEPVRSTRLKIGRKKTIETDYIQGKLSSFPVFRKGSKKVRQQAVFLEAWVARKTGRLAALRIFPMTIKGTPDRANGEFVMLRNYVSSKGVLIPRELLIYDVNGDQRAPQLKVAITEFELNAKLTKQDFLRPK